MSYKFITLLFALLALASCNDTKQLKPTFSKPTIKTVRAIEVTATSENTPIIASGILDSKVDMVVSFKVGGIVEYLNVEEGNRVRKGQSLSGLIQTEIDAQVKLAQQGVDKANRDVTRTTNLYLDTVGTLEQKQNAETALEMAKSQLEIARFNKKYAQLSSPIQGKILKRFVEKGELVAPGQPIYQIASTGGKGSQIIRVGLTDKEIVKLKRGNQATITFDALPSKTITAYVSEIAEVSNPRSGLFPVELTLEKYSPELKNGFIGKVEISGSTKASRLHIPMAAMVEGKGAKAKVFYTQDQQTVKAAELDVIEILDHDFTIAPDALPEDAMLITGGAAYLSEQDSIKVITNNYLPKQLTRK